VKPLWDFAAKTIPQQERFNSKSDFAAKTKSCGTSQQLQLQPCPEVNSQNKSTKNQITWPKNG